MYQLHVLKVQMCSFKLYFSLTLISTNIYNYYRCNLYNKTSYSDGCVCLTYQVL